MVSKKFDLKTSNTDIIDLLENVKNKSKYLEEAVSHYSQCTIQENNIDEKIKQQKYLKLCLENWKQLKESGHIFEEAKAIITGQQELASPTLQKLIVNHTQSEEPKQEKGLDENWFCKFCNHQHYGDGTLHNCRDCNCGVRG